MDKPRGFQIGWIFLSSRDPKYPDMVPRISKLLRSRMMHHNRLPCATQALLTKTRTGPQTSHEACKQPITPRPAANKSADMGQAGHPNDVLLQGGPMHMHFQPWGRPRPMRHRPHDQTVNVPTPSGPDAPAHLALHVSTLASSCSVRRRRPKRQACPKQLLTSC